MITGIPRFVPVGEFYARELKIPEYVHVDIHWATNSWDFINIPAAMRQDCNNANAFEITLNNCIRRQHIPALELLAHEFIHVEQYVSGRMTDELIGNEWFTRWENDPKLYRVDETGGEEYWQSPWEIEAYGRQRELYERWLNS